MGKICISRLNLAKTWTLWSWTSQFLLPNRVIESKRTELVKSHSNQAALTLC